MIRHDASMSDRSVEQPLVTHTHLYETRHARITVDSRNICGLIFKEKLCADGKFIDALDNIEEVTILRITSEGAVFKLDADELVSGLTDVIKVLDQLVTRQQA